MKASELVRSIEDLSESLQVPLERLEIYFDTKAGGRYPVEGSYLARFDGVHMVILSER